MKQSTALSILSTGTNVFLTGEPGSGKSHTVRTYVAWLRSMGVEPTITASTGIAATHIGGMTIHSWSGIGIKKDITMQDLDELSTKERVVKRVANARVLIIDEISMLDAHTLSMTELVIRTLKRNDLPWGGLQVVFVGDFYQLPPVQTSASTAPYTIDFDSGATRPSKTSRFAYSSSAWSAANPIVCYLSEQHRQDDAELLDILSALRADRVSEAHQLVLRERTIESSEIPEEPARLYTHNADVDRENAARLQALSTNERGYTMRGSGPEYLIDTLKRGCLSPESLTLRIGARVMFTKNNPDGSYVNGTLGIVKDFGDSGPIIEVWDGRTIEASPVEWTISDGSAILARIQQIPLRLAWAITIHKSQGMTLDAATIDLSRSFEYGQGYVALSRVRSLKGLHLLGYNQRSLEVHPEVKGQDVIFKRASAEARVHFENMPEAERSRYEQSFIRTIGGNPHGDTPQKKPAQRIVSHMQTLNLTKEKGATIDSIASARGVKTETIISHLETLLEEGSISYTSIESLIPPSNKRRLAAIVRAFNGTKETPLKQVYVDLKGAYSYTDIRTARLLVH